MFELETYDCKNPIYEYATYIINNFIEKLPDKLKEIAIFQKNILETNALLFMPLLTPIQVANAVCAQIIDEENDTNELEEDLENWTKTWMETNRFYSEYDPFFIYLSQIRLRLEEGMTKWFEEDMSQYSDLNMDLTIPNLRAHFIRNRESGRFVDTLSDLVHQLLYPVSNDASDDAINEQEEVFQSAFPDNSNEEFVTEIYPYVPGNETILRGFKTILSKLGLPPKSTVRQLQDLLSGADGNNGPLRYIPPIKNEDALTLARSLNFHYPTVMTKTLFFSSQHLQNAYAMDVLKMIMNYNEKEIERYLKLKVQGKTYQLLDWNDDLNKDLNIRLQSLLKEAVRLAKEQEKQYWLELSGFDVALKKWRPSVSFDKREICLLFLILQFGSFYEKDIIDQPLTNTLYAAPCDIILEAESLITDTIVNNYEGEVEDLNLIERIPTYDEAMNTLARLMFAHVPHFKSFITQDYMFVPPIVMKNLALYYKENDLANVQREWADFMAWQANQDLGVHSENFRRVENTNGFALRVFHYLDIEDDDDEDENENEDEE